jgi:hypothetical protein
MMPSLECTLWECVPFGISIEASAFTFFGSRASKMLVPCGADMWPT